MMDQGEADTATTDTPTTRELPRCVAGQTARSGAALAHLKRRREVHLVSRHTLEVLDSLQNPRLAVGSQLLALPALVRRVPALIRKTIGDLFNEEKVLAGLDTRPRGDR